MVFEGHQAAVRCVCALDDRFVASGSDDRTIKIWDVGKNGKYTEWHNGIYTLDFVSVLLSILLTQSLVRSHL
jgi:WD40 repeat protein